MVIKDYVTILVSSMLVRGGRGNGLRIQEMMDQVLAPQNGTRICLDSTHLPDRTPSFLLDMGKQIHRKSLD